MAAIGLIMVTLSAADLINLALKTWVFPKAEETSFVCPTEYPPSPEGLPARSPVEQREECEKQEAWAQRERVRSRQANAIRDISFLLVGIPLFWFHFRVAQRERREEKENV